MGEIIVRLIDLPVTIPAACFKDSNDDYNIYLNKNLDSFAQHKAYEHEIKHIKLGHFYDDRPVWEKEAEIGA